MKTIKKMAIVFVIITGIVMSVKASKGNIRFGLEESTHQGYRSMIADYIF